MTKVASRLQLFSFQFTKSHFDLQTGISDFNPAEEVETGEYNAAIIANIDINALLLLS